MNPDDFLIEVEPYLLCIICENVLVEPKSCKAGHTFCDVCISKWLARNKTCPMDREQLAKEDLATVRIASAAISGLHVRCPNNDGGGSGGGPPVGKKQKSGKGKAKAKALGAVPGGCEWTGTVADRPAHHKIKK